MSAYSSYSDPELTALLKTGDHAAFDEVYQRYYLLMINFAFKKLSDEELAKDFVQELFSRLWSKRHKLEENGNLSSYLYITLRSRILDHLIHQQVEYKYVNSLKDYVSAGYSVHTDYLVREKEMNSFIEKAIETLPKKMREVFELSRKDNLSNREIAEKLNTTESNISHHISNAVKILRTKLSAILMFFLV